MTVPNPGKPNRSQVWKVGSSRTGNGSGLTAPDVLDDGLQPLVEVGDGFQLALDIDAERKDFESVPLGLMFFVELDQIGDSMLQARIAGEAPEVDQKPLPLEVGNLRVLWHAASIEDVPLGRFLAVMLGVITPGAGGLGSLDPPLE